MSRISVKLKVTLWYTLVMVIISAVVLIAMTSISREMIDRDITGRITKVVSETAMQMVDREGNLRPVPSFKLYEHGVHMALFDEDYKLIDGQIPFGITEELDFVNDYLRHETYDDNKYYVFDKNVKTRDSDHCVWIKGFVSVTDESFAVDSVVKNNLILTCVLILVAAFGGYFIISRAFVPVNKMSRTAKEISRSSDLSRRINIGKGNDEIHELANTLDEMLEKIEQTFEREKQFTSDASHELRTPVSVILSECEYASDCATTVDDIKESVSSIKRQADKMSKLISELLTISRMDKNTLQTNFEQTDISELLSFVCDEQEEIQSGKIILERNIPEGICAKADRFLLARLFINLISNAYQYSNDTGTVRVSLALENGNVVFTVLDHGVGIAEENIPKIWERLYQVDPSRTSNENGSIGLGLSMVEWIAKCHGGNVSVRSELGRGSEFKFEFPKDKN